MVVVGDGGFMKKENKVMYIYIVIILLFCLVLIYLYFSKNNNSTNVNYVDNSTNKNQNSINNKTTNSNKDEDDIISGDKLQVLDNETMFFSLQNSINTYYENMGNDKYIKNIIIDKKENNDHYLEISFIMEKAYYQELNDSEVYFVNGYLLDSSSESSSYIDNVSYFIYKKNNTIRLKRIETNNFEKYIKNIYYNKSINIKDGVEFTTQSITDESKLSFYISCFKNLLYRNPKKAYSYLDNNMLKYYDKYSIFYAKIDDIYEKMSSVIFSYGVNGQNEEKVYNIVDNNQNIIVITESGIMDYKIFINIY